VLELLVHHQDTSLPVVVAQGGKNKLVGMVSAMDVLERLILTLGDLDTMCPSPVAGGSEAEEDR
jgi:hypothetical protein